MTNELNKAEQAILSEMTMDMVAGPNLMYLMYYYKKYRVTFTVGMPASPHSLWMQTINATRQLKEMWDKASEAFLFTSNSWTVDKKVTTIESLMSKKNSVLFDVFRHENYQTLEKENKLLESIFKKRCIGSITVFQNKEDCYEVLDGRVRFRIIKSFIENKLSFKGRDFNSLYPSEQNEFMNTPVYLTTINLIKKFSGNKMTYLTDEDKKEILGL